MSSPDEQFSLRFGDFAGPDSKFEALSYNVRLKTNYVKTNYIAITRASCFQVL
jgi:hypothetical protein